MRDMVTCFSEHAVRISETTCSSHYAHHPSSSSSCTTMSMSQQKLIPSIQNTVISMYKIILSTKKQQLITVTWCNKDPMGGFMSLSFSNDPSNSTILKLNPFSRFFKKKKGSKSFEFEDNTKMEVFWDLSTANYGSGPEPISKYYVILIIDSELGLVLGDHDFLADAAAARKQLLNYKGLISNKMAKFTLISRREHYGSSGNAAICCSTKAKFVDRGNVHDILIRCSSCCGENDHGLLKQQQQQLPAVLSVSIDKKMVLRVKRLQWNFRGNQTIFIDGLLVDLFWDVHDWFFFNRGVRGGTVNGYYDAAVFMFRTRSGMESRLWLLEDHKVAPKKDQHNDIDFSLLMYASK